MSRTAPPEVTRLAERVQPVLLADERARFAYLFGSVARGQAAPGSDVDLAVYLRPDGTLMDEARLHDALATALGREDVDMVALNRAPLWLQFRVLGEGTVVFSRDERERISFREHTERDFLDFLPFYEEYLAATRNRARRGALSRG